MNKEFIETKISTAQVQEVFRKKGYDFFAKGAFNLNIFGIRAENKIANEFDDLICVYYRSNAGGNIELRYPATTDPGTYWLLNPMSPGGSAILVEGQYKSAYQLGKHYGHEALVQIAPVSCYRDNNKDNVLDQVRSTITTGLYGINIHSAWWVEEADVVGNASAGCQVFKKKSHHASVIDICKQAAKIYGNKFTYTLFNQTDFI